MRACERCASARLDSTAQHSTMQYGSVRNALKEEAFPARGHRARVLITHAALIGQDCVNIRARARRAAHKKLKRRSSSDGQGDAGSSSGLLRADDEPAARNARAAGNIKTSLIAGRSEPACAIRSFYDATAVQADSRSHFTFASKDADPCKTTDERC